MPTPRRPALLLLALLATCHTAHADLAPTREFARALLLLPSKTVWIYGGMTTYNATQSQWDILTELDVSISWNADLPAYTDRTNDGAGVSPDTIYGTLFPTGDQTGFYSFDAYGVNNNYAFAKYDTTAHLWTTYPTTGVVLPNAGPAAYDTSGNTWVWGGRSISGTYDPNDIFRWDPVSQLWSKSTPPVTITQRSWHTANLLPTGVIIIIGGMNQIYNGTAWNNFWADMKDTPSYDTSSGVWHSNVALGSVPQSRNLHTTVLSQDGFSLIVYGGSAPAAVNGVIPSLRPSSGSSEVTLSDIQILDTRTYTWVAPTVHGVVPLPRFGHTAVQVGGQMIVMGGSIGQNYTANLVNDTYIMDTTQWSWTSTYTPPTNWTSVFAATTTTTASITASDSLSLSPSSTAVQSPTSGNGSGSGIGTGTIAGISVGAVAVIAVAAGAFFFMRYNRPRHAAPASGSDYFPQNQGPPQYGSSAQPYGAPPQPGQQYGMQFASPPLLPIHGGQQNPPPPPPHQSIYGYPQAGYSYPVDGQGYSLRDPAVSASSAALYSGYAAPLSPKHADRIDVSPNEYSESVPPPWRPTKIDQDQTKVGVIGLADLSKPDDTVDGEGDEDEVIQYRY